MSATCSAEFGTRMVPGAFMIAEFTSPMTATSTPGHRPAMMVVIIMAGMKKMKVTREWVIGKIAQCIAAAPTPMRAAKAKRRGVAFSIHGHNLEMWSSVFRRESRQCSPWTRPGQRLLPAPPERRSSGHRRWLPGVLRQSLIDPGPFRSLGGPDRGAWFHQLGVIERAIAHEDQVRALFGLAEQVRATLRTEAPMHHIAALGHAAIVSDGCHFSTFGCNCFTEAFTAGQSIPSGRQPHLREPDRCSSSAMRSSVAGCDSNSAIPSPPRRRC